MKAAGIVLAFACAAALAHDGHKHEGGHHHGAHKPPASRSVDGVVSLDLYRDGESIHVLTARLEGESASLWHRRSRDGGATFSLPVRVDAGLAGPRSPRRGDDVQVAARGDTVVALWSVPGTGWGGSGPFASAVSRDGGQTWRAGGNPSDTGLTTGHGFADLRFDAVGLHAVWLDNRDKAQGLRYAFSADGERWGPSATIAAATCECCWNTIATHGAETLVMYRAKGPRDMTLAAAAAGTWSVRGRVGAFDWHVKGCPETGGGLAATPDGTLHALVWTGRDGATGLHYLRSADAGRAWARPRRLGGAQAQHNDLAANGRRLAAVWDEGDAIYFALSRDAGGEWERPARLSARGASAMNPRVVAAGDGFIVLWTERAADGPWRLGEARLP